MKANKSSKNMNLSPTVSRNAQKRNTNISTNTITVKRPIVNSKSTNNMIRHQQPKLSKLNSQTSIANVNNLTQNVRQMNRYNSLKPFAMVDPEFYKDKTDLIFDKEVHRINYTERALSRCTSDKKLNESRSKILFSVN